MDRDLPYRRVIVVSTNNTSTFVHTHPKLCKHNPKQIVKGKEKEKGGKEQ